MRPLAIATLLLLGCAAAPLGYQDLALPLGSGKGPLHADDVAREVAMVRYTLDTAYSGLGFVPEERWAKMGEKLQAAKRARSPEQLCNSIASALAELPDAHLQVKLAGKRCGPRPQRRPQVGPSYAGPPSRRPYAMDFLTTGGATFAVLALQALPAHEDASWKGFDGALAALSDSHAVLIDLRGNQGGDDTQGRALARALLDAQVSSAAVRVHVRQTPEAVTLRLNDVERAIRDGARELGGRRRRLQGERDQALAPHAPPWIVETPPPRPPPGEHAFAGPVAIVVDAGCASSCEGTLQALRVHPRARVFGERTGGFVEFGELGLLVLPQSGVELLVPTKHWELPPGAAWEKVGIPPDVETKPGEDAFDAAMGWLRAEVPQSKILSAAEFTIPEGQRKREAERLRALGLRVRGEGPVLEKPYAQPLSRRSYVVPESWLWRQPPRVVFAPALRADLEVLRTAMERAYGGWQVAEQHGWRWASWFADWEAHLDAAGERWLPLTVAFAPVQKLEQHQLDNHTNIPLGLRFGGGSRTVRLVDAPLGPCTALEDKAGRTTALSSGDPGRLPRRARRWDGTSITDVHYLVYPSVGEPPVAIVCGERRIGFEPVDTLGERVLSDQVRRLAGQSFDRPWLRHLSEGVAYLRLPTFSKQNGELIRRDREKWERRTGKESTLVVDLRGNDGGDADFDALEQWIDEKDLRELVEDDRQHAGSCLYPALRWGYAAISSSGLKAPISRELARGLQAGLDELFRRDDPACRARWVESHARRHYGARSTPPRALKPRILVLVDNGCGSDCELMAETLGKLPEATVAGQNTYGVAQFIQPGYSVLPNTRLPFRIALGTSDAYGDGRSFDGYGLDVDVLLDGAAASTDDGLLHLIEVLSR